MKLKCAVIDDEPLAIDVILSHIKKIDILEVVGTGETAMDAFEIMTRKKVDILFLDIQMPGMKGTDFLKNLKNPPKVILTTAYREYALEGYELDVVDYLLKPISFERFFKAVTKAINQSVSASQPVPNIVTDNNVRYIYIKINKKIHKVLLTDITYAECIKDYIKIHTTSGNLITKQTIASFEELLPATEFLRIHRSFIVSVNKIKSFTANSVDVGTELPIGRSYKQQVFSSLSCAGFEE
jgi:DNA-binding LytR/AlgR family response regulator